jgi:DNA-binding PadR family transcriptional regulator
MDTLARPGVSLRRAMRIGGAKLLILKALSARPGHGCEVAKEISAIFDGGYAPGPGVIFPTLQWLQDRDFVAGKRGSWKTVCKITATGRGSLEENGRDLDAEVRFLEKRSGGDPLPLRRSAARLERTILISVPEISDERRAEVAGVLDDATARIPKPVDQA